MIPALDIQLDLVLRASVADHADAIEAARAFMAGFDPDLPLDPRVYAALPALYARLGRSGTSDDPRTRLVAGIARQTWTHNQFRLSATRSALDALARVGATPLVLPGALTAIAALGDSGARVFEQLEVLIRADHIPRAAAALLARGATIRQDHASLLEGRLAGQPLLFGELEDGAFVVRWDHPGLGAADLDAFRARSEPLSIGTVTFAGPRPEDALIAVLAGLTDTNPGPAGWTNLVLELARLQRRLGGDPVPIEAAARCAHAADRHLAWAAWLRLVAHLSADDGDAQAAERFAAVRQPLAPSAPRARGSTPPRSPLGRALRMFRQYRAVASQSNERVTARGLVRYLNHRWQLDRGRDLPRELVRRLIRARRPQPRSEGSGSARSSSPTMSSRAPIE